MSVLLFWAIVICFGLDLSILVETSANSVGGEMIKLLLLTQSLLLVCGELGGDGS
jgi:hypothetical protein